MTFAVPVETPDLVTPAKRVMFVDDDEFLLDGLRDGLRPYRRTWAMRFVSSGEEALASIETEPPDVLISDLRMPGMDGATLLELVRDRCPGAIRIVLSGHADIKVVARAAGAAHRLVAKPCETGELAGVIERSCALQNLGSRVELDRRPIGASALPSVPRLYAQLTELLTSGSASAADIARIVETDIAMAAKVLQLANSAYFGRRSPVTNVANAVAYLGTETLRAMVLQAEAISELQVEPAIPGFELETLQRHCTRVARVAAALAKRTGAGAAESALTAGLLHDIGLLVLAAQDGAGLAELLAASREQGRPLHVVERDRHSVTHADIGAHLLALWGLPHSVTEAVAGHHGGEWLKLPFDAVSATYVANILVEEVEAEFVPEAALGSELDLEYLERAGLSGQLPAWRRLAVQLCLDPAG
jgi:putative nucleotidyltransferase with HDIG domain